MNADNPTPQPATEAPRLSLDQVLLPEGFAALPGPVDFAELFGNARPVELEIGTGKGTFLVRRAAQRPELNFLGIEWARQFCHYAADRMCRHGLANVRMLRTDAEGFVLRRIPDESLQRVHIYFPDPWPKRKHNRRRLIKPPFVSVIHRKLRIGGQLAIVTDHADYARQIGLVVPSQAGFAVVPFPEGLSENAGETVGTNFERKYIAQGRTFFRLAVMKWR